MNETTPSPSHEGLLDPERLPRFQIANRKEIVHLLRGIADRRALLIAHIDGGPLTFVTTVLDLTADGEGVILDSSPDHDIMQRVERAERLVCSGRIDGVRLQFAADDPAGYPHDGFEALRCDLPAMILRLQRRESFRLHVPLSSPVECKLMLCDASGVPQPVTVRVLDISSEGVGLMIVDESTPVEPGQIIDSELTVPDVGVTRIPLQLRNVYRLENRGGGISLRAGFQLLDPPARLVSALQRYIFRIERERRLLETNR